MNTQTKKQSGFTIIEVVLVLAIAGLIFLMVFIALPALQRNQRDTQRKDDLARIKTAVSNFSASNRGAVPTSATFTGFTSKYLVPASEYTDPQGTAYAFTYDTAGSVSDNEVVYANGRVCGLDGAFVTNYEGVTAKARDFAVAIKLESQTAPYCLDSN